VEVEVAMSYNDDFKEHIFSYVNNINTIEGGTHITGFRRALTRVFKQYGEKEGLFERAKVEVEGDDFREGLSAIISVKVPEPQFEGQTKTKLGNSEVSGIVETTVARALEAYLEENPKESKNVIQKVILAAQASGKACFPAEDSPASWPIAPTGTRTAASYTWWKGIRQVVRPNRAVTAASRLSCRSGVRS